MQPHGHSLHSAPPWGCRAQGKKACIRLRPPYLAPCSHLACTSLILGRLSVCCIFSSFSLRLAHPPRPAPKPGFILLSHLSPLLSPLISLLLSPLPSPSHHIHLLLLLLLPPSCVCPLALLQAAPHSTSALLLTSHHHITSISSEAYPNSVGALPSVPACTACTARGPSNRHLTMNSPTKLVPFYSVHSMVGSQAGSPGWTTPLPMPVHCSWGGCNSALRQIHCTKRTHMLGYANTRPLMQAHALIKENCLPAQCGVGWPGMRPLAPLTSWQVARPAGD